MVRGESSPCRKNSKVSSLYSAVKIFAWEQKKRLRDYTCTGCTVEILYVDLDLHSHSHSTFNYNLRWQHTDLDLPHAWKSNAQNRHEFEWQNFDTQLLVTIRPGDEQSDTVGGSSLPVPSGRGAQTGPAATQTHPHLCLFLVAPCDHSPSCTPHHLSVVKFITFGEQLN